ncbi:Daunorubicin/doxorubicin resistance ATP-binding protein DrrA [Porphyridium purpureum]|uniref:Probable ATP-dependent transporter ycf16 n=1 Tax=Porphyridium purpureum TaxID=35688 RepID=A0A5J4YNB7_PORPP|nr:Daunorubicin/doxorubicin resistance ATP-binding protein DrrA [Porphyridium purpureum]|eukprot:POR2461..scf222_8
MAFTCTPAEAVWAGPRNGALRICARRVGSSGAVGRPRAHRTCMWFGIFEDPPKLDMDAPAIDVASVSKTYVKFVAARPQRMVKEGGEGDTYGTDQETDEEMGKDGCTVIASPSYVQGGPVKAGGRNVPNIKKSKKQKLQVVALDRVNFAVPKGSIVALLGPNASGKTTLMRCLTGLERPDSGAVHMFGVDVRRYPRYARMLFGFVAQDAGLDKVLTGREHLDLFARLAHLDRETREQNIEEAIEILKLENFIDNLTATYSGGVKKRLDIALALLPQPPILILDEPSAALDVDSRAIVWDVLRAYRDNGGTVLISTHYLEEADLLSDRVVIMDKGMLISEGSAKELKSKIGGRRMTIRLNEFSEAVEATRVLNELQDRNLLQHGVINASLGNALELTLQEKDEKNVFSALRGAGYDSVFGYASSQPSLGDVYLAATGNTIENADLRARERRDIKQMRKESMK